MLKVPTIIPHKPNMMMPCVKNEAESKKKETKIVCVKVANIRPQYNDLREWIADSNNVYIARKGVVLLYNPQTGKKARYPLQDSKFANPFTVKDHGLEGALSKYRVHLENQIRNGEITEEDLENLRGKNLGCWCKPGECHGDIIL